MVNTTILFVDESFRLAKYLGFELQYYQYYGLGISSETSEMLINKN